MQRLAAGLQRAKRHLERKFLPAPVQGARLENGAFLSEPSGDRLRRVLVHALRLQHADVSPDERVRRVAEHGV
ncbi:MAG TPA: hypothetical protein VD838_07945, partial [Anaeromyxobacteraceae bacterium]|nr:hypothetical protein [Anaeromyxobacteraceae bacterium]